MDRFVIRNYGSSRNLPDGCGSYIFMERDSARETNNEDLAKLFASYPDVHVAERGGRTISPASTTPPKGPPPPPEPPDDQDKDDQGEDNDDQGESEKAVQSEAVDYSALLVADLQAVAEERHIVITGFKKVQLIEALLQDDAKKAELLLHAELTIDQPVKYEDEDEDYVISAVPEVVGGKFTIKNTEGEEFDVEADQLVVRN